MEERVKASPTMQQMVQQLLERYNSELCSIGAFLRLDLPEYDSLVIDHMGPSQIAMMTCFVECGKWQIDREVIFFTGNPQQWIPIEITQLETGWTAFARLSSDYHRIARINPCDQEKLAEFTERWARKLMRQNWLEQGTPYLPWTPPSRKELV
jgi:hypothetical protein